MLSTAALGRLLKKKKKKNMMTRGIRNLRVRNSACVEKREVCMHPEGTGLAAYRSLDDVGDFFRPTYASWAR